MYAADNHYNYLITKFSAEGYVLMFIVSDGAPVRRAQSSVEYRLVLQVGTQHRSGRHARSSQIDSYIRVCVFKRGSNAAMTQCESTLMLRCRGSQESR